jgi:hypothetical protein
MKGGFPLVSLEADTDPPVGNQNGAFDQHAVGSQQGYLVIQAHAGKPVFQIHALVQQAAGIEKPLGRQAALFNPGPEFLRRGILLHNMAVLIGNALLVKPLFSFLASRALGIFNKQGRHTCTLAP